MRAHCQPAARGKEVSIVNGKGNGSGNGNGTANQTEQLRIRYGFWTVLVGLLIVAGVFVGAILTWKGAADVATGVGSVTTVIGTIDGAFFGVQAGSAGKEQAEAARQKAEFNAVTLAKYVPIELAERVHLI